MTHHELEERAGEKIGGKVVIFMLGGQLWHRLEDGRWERYPETPEPAPTDGAG